MLSGMLTMPVVPASETVVLVVSGALEALEVLPGSVEAVEVGLADDDPVDDWVEEGGGEPVSVALGVHLSAARVKDG